MILDESRITDIAQDGKRIVQAGDAQIVIPPMILFTVEPAAPLSVATDTVVLQQSSFIIENAGNRNNVAGADDQVCTINKGLWNLQIDFTLAPSGFASLNFVELLLNLGSYRVRLVVLPASGSSLQSKTCDRLLNLRETATLWVRYPATGVAEYLYYRTAIVATRLL